MKRIDPNVLLAITTLFAVALLVMSATIFGPADPPWRYVATAAVVTVVFLVLQPFVPRFMKMKKGPLVIAEAPSSAVWAAIYPGLIILAAALPPLFPGVSFGLAVVIAAVFLGSTIESAIMSLRKA
ncbi:hypothetical protein IWC96_11365 [Brevundimonas sp. BAL450]|uniref:Uncharacterized protein n=1 Tax=Brevundimonas abyssalis TAR-001 TaxID=1391729 RepID=A0A8E0KHL7_9CAUL|nr:MULTISPECIES: hypothetical protein [Brevundimonas]MBG7615871.1 hypothetical protein [Brevundimonas sp. BAL450]GAD57911.1 hypothetical protein MBEBAB_0161 [Brevundimonas abyssalis TAR-001]